MQLPVRNDGFYFSPAFQFLHVGISLADCIMELSRDGDAGKCSSQFLLCNVEGILKEGGTMPTAQHTSMLIHFFFSSKIKFCSS